MKDSDKSVRRSPVAPAGPKPEEMGRPVPGKGEAIEPEATRAVVDGAVKAGDRMWGPPGSPDGKN